MQPSGVRLSALVPHDILPSSMRLTASLALVLVLVLVPIAQAEAEANMAAVLHAAVCPFDIHIL